MVQPEFSRSMAEMDHSHVELPRFLDPNEISQPPQERMKTLEAAITELKRAQVESPTSQVEVMELIRVSVQIQPTPFKSMKEEMAPISTSGKLTFEKNILKKRRV